MTSTTSTAPILSDLLNFSWVDSNDQPVMVISTSDLPAKLQLFNTSPKTLTFATPSTQQASSSNYHLAVSFRPNILINTQGIQLQDATLASQTLNQASTELPTSQWSIAIEPASPTGSDVVTLYILATQSISLPTQDPQDITQAQLTLTFSGVQLNPATTAFSTRVQLGYNKITQSSNDSGNSDDSDTVQISDSDAATVGDTLQQVVALTKQIGLPNAPLSVGLLDGHNVIPDGQTNNSLKLAIWNTSSAPLSLTSSSQFVISFVQTDGQSAFSSNDSKTLPVLTSSSDGWTLQQSSVDSVIPQWLLTATDSTTLANGTPVELQIDNLVTSAQGSCLQIQIQYGNISGYWDGSLQIAVDLSYLDTDGPTLAIGTTPNENTTLTLNGDTGGNQQALYAYSNNSQETVFCYNQSTGIALHARSGVNSNAPAGSAASATLYVDNNLGNNAVNICNNTADTATMEINNSGIGNALSVTNNSGGIDKDVTSTLAVSNGGNNNALFAQSGSDTRVPSGAAASATIYAVNNLGSTSLNLANNSATATTAYIINDGSGNALTACNSSGSISKDNDTVTVAIANGSGDTAISATNNGSSTTAAFQNSGSGSALSVQSSGKDTTATFQNNDDGSALSVQSSDNETTATFQNSGNGSALSVTSSGDQTLVVTNSGVGTAISAETGGGPALSLTASTLGQAMLINAGVSSGSIGSPESIPTAAVINTKGPMTGLSVTSNNSTDFNTAIFSNNGINSLSEACVKVYGGNQAALHVISPAYYSGITAYFINAATDSKGFNATAVGVSGDIYLTGNVHNHASVSFSDERLKNITGSSQAQADLSTLNRIQVVNYTEKADTDTPPRQYKKVVAQALQKVYPQAVYSGIQHTLPNIMQEVDIKEGQVQYAGKPIALAEGDRVTIRFHDPEDKSQSKPYYQVSDVSAASFQINNRYSGKALLVGTLVDDVLGVDYDALGCLTLSATQALSQQVKEQQQEIDQLKQQVAALLKKLG